MPSPEVAGAADDLWLTLNRMRGPVCIDEAARRYLALRREARAWRSQAGVPLGEGDRQECDEYQDAGGKR